MSMREAIQAQLNDELKKQGEKLSTLRLLWSAIRNEEIDKKRDLTDQEIEQVVKKQSKQLKDSLADFESGGRDDLVQNVKKEIEILSVYLPEELSDDELSIIVDSVISEVGEVDPSKMGQIMGSVMSKVAGRADGSRVKEMVVKKISN